MEAIRHAVIGGSGVYEIEGLQVIEERTIETPFGSPSSPLLIGELSGRAIAFLARHGKNHEHNPTHVPVRANVWALKKIGVESVISISATGSLKEEIEPAHLVLPDQLIDRTRSRVNSFFEEAAVHVGFGHPFCERLRQRLLSAAEGCDFPVHDGGTYVCMEGPLFSTVAESNLHRSWGASLIGMTALPEAKLVREAEMCYATIAMATDYDVWKEEHVTVDMVIRNLQTAAGRAKAILKRFFAAEEQDRDCDCAQALAGAIMTQPAAIPPERRKDWELLIGKYLKDV